MGPKLGGILNIHLKMGMNMEQSLVMTLTSENEGGTAEVLTNPVDERIKDPISNSNTETTMFTTGESDDFLAIEKRIG